MDHSLRHVDTQSLERHGAPGGNPQRRTSFLRKKASAKPSSARHSFPLRRINPRKVSAVNQGFRIWLAKVLRMASVFPSASALVRGTNPLGTPRSPSHFGTSYSRIVWSRQVFQVRSEIDLWS